MLCNLEQPTGGARLPFGSSFYEEDRGRQGLCELKVGHAPVLKSSHTWGHPIGSFDSQEEVAWLANWQDAEHPSQWIKFAMA